MSVHFDTFAQFAAAGWPVLADAAVKGSVVLSAAWATTLAMRRGSAALRHLVWVLAVCGILALPMVEGLLPGWRILPAWIDRELVAATPAASPARPAGAQTTDGPRGGLPDPFTGRPERPVLTATTPREAAASTNGAGADSAARASAPEQAAPAPQPPGWRRGDWRAVAVAVWGGGVAIMLLPVVVSLLALRRLARRSDRFDGGRWGRLLGDAAERLGLRRPVTLLRGRRRAMPMTWGIVSPKLLLPPEADGWSRDRRRVVLMHELAHVRRGDFLTQLIAHLVRSIYWFNPLVWVASRRIALESEQACDDLVLNGGTRASDYAEHLLTLAAGLTGRRRLPAAAVAMARSSRLEGRLLAILDADRNRRGLNAAAIMTATVLVAGVLLPLAMVRAGDGAERPAAAGGPDRTAAERSSEIPPGARAAAESHRVVLNAGLDQARAVARAKEKAYESGLVDRLTLEYARNRVDVLEAEISGDPVRLAEARRDGARRLLALTTALFDAGLVARSDVQAAKGDVAVAEARLRDVVRPAGRAGPPAGAAAPPAAAVVAPGEVAGAVADEAGRPLAGVLVDAWTWCPGDETTTDRAGRFALKKLGPGPVEIRVSKDGFGPWYDPVQPTGVEMRVKLSNRTYFEGDVKAPDGKPVGDALVRADAGPKRNPGVAIPNVWTETRSDRNGHYRLYVAPDNYVVQVRMPKVGAARLPTARIEAGEAKTLDLNLSPGVTFRAIVVDSESGRPVPAVRLSHGEHKGVEGTSGRDGKLSIDGMSPGNFTFNVGAAGYTRWWSPQAAQPHQKKDVRGSLRRNFDDLDFDVAGDMVPVKIELEREVRITGVVRDPDGHPVAGATVAAADGTGNSLAGDTRYSVLTAKDGTFVLTLPASGDAEYNLEAHDGGHQQWRTWANGVLSPIRTKPGDELKNVVIKLTRPATVRGHVKDEAGKPLVGREVRASAADRRENRYYDPTTTTDKTGDFELRFIRPGDQFIQAAPFFWTNVPPGGLTLKLKAGQTNSLLVTLKADETKAGVELTAPASTKFPSPEEQLRRALERMQHPGPPPGRAYRQPSPRRRRTRPPRRRRQIRSRRGR